MKESLEFLNVKSSGLEEINSPQIHRLTDDELLNKVQSFKSNPEKEFYLRSFFANKVAGYVKSKRYLVGLVKDRDPQFACELILSASTAAPLDSENYLLFANLAIEHSAWQIAKGALEIVKWTQNETQVDISSKVESLNKYVQEKISSKVQDNSRNLLWHNKETSKHWVLERLYFQSKLEKLIEYSFKLLDIFPNDIANYDVAYKALSLLDDKKIFYKFNDYVNNYLSFDKVNQNLYLGISSYILLNFEESIKYLNNALSLGAKNPKVLFYLALNYLFKNQIKDFIQTSEKIIPISDPAFIALYFIYSSVRNFTFDKSEFPDQKNISKEASTIIEKLIINGQMELVNFLVQQFQKLDYFIILPYLPLYLAEVFIKNNNIDHAKEILNGCSDTEIHRLYAWIYRLEGKDDLAELELVNYRKSWLPKSETGIHCKLVNLNLPYIVPDKIDEVLSHVKNAYKQTKDLIREFDLEYGLNAMTCIETGCQDCCTKTFPYISFIEYLYLKNWLDDGNDQLKEQIKNNSIQIVNLYKEKYKKEPPFINGDIVDKHKYYPIEFVFNCPCLGNNKCNVYEARPFTCRTYSYGSRDGTKYKGCNYFFEQLKGATKLHDVRKVVNMASFFEYSKVASEKLIGKNIIAPIPVWFAQSHEQVLEKIRELKD